MTRSRCIHREPACRHGLPSGETRVGLLKWTDKTPSSRATSVASWSERSNNQASTVSVENSSSWLRVTILALSYARNINTVFMNGLSARIGYLQQEGILCRDPSAANYWGWNFALAYPPRLHLLQMHVFPRVVFTILR